MKSLFILGRLHCNHMPWSDGKRREQHQATDNRQY